MFDVWTTADPYTGGLADSYSDCLTTVGGYAPDYVFAGTIIRLTTPIYYSTFEHAFGNHEKNIREAVNSIGTISNVGVSVSGFGTLEAVIQGVSTIDRASSRDIEGDILRAMRQAGYQALSPSLEIVWRPSAQQVCQVFRGGLKPLPGREGGQVTTGGIAPVSGEGQRQRSGLENFWTQNKSWLLLGGFGILAAGIVFKK